jgi:hypothetical protein
MHCGHRSVEGKDFAELQTESCSTDVVPASQSRNENVILLTQKLHDDPGRAMTRVSALHGFLSGRT